MAIWQGRSHRKTTGGRVKFSRKKRKFEIGREQQHTVVGTAKYKFARTRGYNNKKIRALKIDMANVLDPKSNKIKRARIDSVVENPSNPQYIQRNIITKGATIKTDLGLAKVTSRQGQQGIVNATLIKK